GALERSLSVRERAPASAETSPHSLTTLFRSQGRAHEAAGLGDVAGAGAAAPAQEVVEGDLQFAGAVVAQARRAMVQGADVQVIQDRKSTRLNSSHVKNSYAVLCLKKKKQTHQ